MVFDEAGTYQIEYTATDECGNTTNAERTVIVEAPQLYGVLWDGGENSKLTRTDSSASFADPVPQMSDGNGGWTVGSSPFDNIMPWSGMEIVEDAEAGTLVSIPKFYFKWTSEGDSLKLQISPQPLEGFSTSPAHADRNDGVGERDVVYVGRYHCSSDDYKSTTNVMPKASTVRSDFITNISSIGQNVWMEDFPLFWTIRMLYLVEFADWNSQATIGVGCSPNNAVFQNGATDSMQYHTGTTASSRSLPSAVQYRNIENLWANVQEQLAGLFVRVGGASSLTGQLYWETDPSLYSDGTNAIIIDSHMVDVNGTISKWKTGASSLGFLTPQNILSPADNTKYVCDAYGKYNVDGYLIVGGYYVNLDGLGMFRMVCSSEDTSNAFSGTRLQKLP